MTDGVRFLTERGYHEVKRDWESRLFVKGFDFTRFDSAGDRVARQASASPRWLTRCSAIPPP